jgi:hypothetical protein
MEYAVDFDMGLASALPKANKPLMTLFVGI